MRRLISSSWCRPSAVWASYRNVITTVTAANFDAEVMQSQCAICLVYTVDDSKCTHHIKAFETACDKLNASTTLHPRSRPPVVDKEGRWLKLCQIDGDSNRNLASAFSVERNKLPVTFFIYMGTVVDRVSGPLPAERMESILSKFQEYYAEYAGVDMSKKDGNEGVMLSPVKKSLSGVTSTKHKLNHLQSSLLGADRIRLPEEVNHVDGLRKDLQETKKLAFEELYKVHQKNGLDVRKASELELERLLYGTEQFHAAATISGLEALLLARIYAIGGNSNVQRQAVVDGKTAVERDFLKRQLQDDTVRQCVALCDVCVVAGDAKRTLATLTTPSEEELAKANEEAKRNGHPALAGDPLSQYQFLCSVLRWVDVVDHRLVAAPGFPSAEADAMLAVLKKLFVTARRNEEDGVKFKLVKSLLLATLQLYAKDSAAVAMRSRLSSILF